ncbi:pyridoxal phosphate-dependent transferase [Cantharellus anzutake]|uniref:pyridoxal phosphate-dependent transferase n=1 Tax=Cantharellus anzutake TaxID=1750568 RepID=UPI0019072877|nr:pyridoxal phosphate-dependent transferase [Cantharellus anzutake]KAF8318581.1 pyridoxal phosphate-dependent transferase [Cantharellus anzutake]
MALMQQWRGESLIFTWLRMMSYMANRGVERYKSNSPGSVAGQDANTHFMMDVEGFRKAGYEAIDNICDYYGSLASRPVAAQVEPRFLVDALPHQAPELSKTFQTIFRSLPFQGLPIGNTPSSSLISLVVIRFRESSLTCTQALSQTLASTSPARTELEQVAMDWAANLLGLSSAFFNTPPVVLPSFTRSSASSSPGPEGRRPTRRGGGTIQNTAPESVLVAIIAARERFLSAHPDVPSEDLLILSTQTHSLGVKGAKILGLSCRLMPALRGALEGKCLEWRHNADLCFSWNMGTTSSGANDHIEEMGPIISELDDVWLHIDAAWARVSFACPEFRRAGKLDAINAYADSFCTNFHKWGLVNIGFREHIRKGVRLAELFEDNLMSRNPETRIFELVTLRALSLVVFRLVVPPLSTGSDGSEQQSNAPTPAKSEPPSLETLNSLNLALHQYLPHPPNSDSANALFLTRTELNGVVCMRMAIGAEATTEAHITKALGILDRVGRKILTDTGHIVTRESHDWLL